MGPRHGAFDISACILEEVVHKRVVWHGDSLDRVRSFPQNARQDAGYQIGRVQRGLEPRDWKHMKTAGRGVMEIRIHAGGEYRVFYLATVHDAVHVLHAFQKKTRQTRQSDIKLAAARYREVFQE
jgi:phage-related protein